MYWLALGQRRKTALHCVSDEEHNTQRLTMVAATFVLLSILLVIANQQLRSCHAFHALQAPYHKQLALSTTAGGDHEATLSSNKQLDRRTAQQFTIKVCTSTSCSKKLQQLGLDRYQILGDLYEKARIDNVEEDLIIEDGGCRGGKNCKLGPCVAIFHEDFDGSVALEGMGQTEFNERVFHGVSRQDDVDRVWGCVANAIDIMADEANES